ncbi:MAG: Bax inhibitor-1/YccA family protein [Hyphomonadaceae bacterium]|nr:Bax inhibitor-1/YccA family protein [Clostridia bacterium]
MENGSYYQSQGQVAESLGGYTSKVFGWMFLGLLTTFLVSMFCISTVEIPMFFAKNIPVFYGLCIAEVIFVWFMASRILKMSVTAAKASFLAYSAVNGITLMFIFMVYELGSIVYVFGVCALFFGVMALYGYVTKTDLSGIGKILIFGVFALAGFWILSLFLNLSAFERIVSFIGIGIFLGLTAYDTQKIKAYYYNFQGNPDMLAKASIFAALQLYLDFINLFLYLLRVMGRRR